MTTTTRDLTTYHLANLADCASPDARDAYGCIPSADASPSPGAVFLRDVADAYDGARDDLSEHPYPEDLLHELADGAVPIYTHSRWQTFTDLCAYNEDLTEYGAPPADMTDAAGLALYIIARRLLEALHADR